MHKIGERTGSVASLNHRLMAAAPVGTRNGFIPVIVTAGCLAALPTSAFYCPTAAHSLR